MEIVKFVLSAMSSGRRIYVSENTPVATENIKVAKMFRWRWQAENYLRDKCIGKSCVTWTIEQYKKEKDHTNEPTL